MIFRRNSRKNHYLFFPLTIACSTEVEQVEAQKNRRTFDDVDDIPTPSDDLDEDEDEVETPVLIQASWTGYGLWLWW